MLWLVVVVFLIYGIPLVICVTLIGIIFYLEHVEGKLNLEEVLNTYFILLCSFVPLINLKVMLLAAKGYTSLKRRAKP